MFAASTKIGEELLDVRPQGYPARLRLKRRRDFLRVQRGGTKHHVRHFLIFVAPREAESSSGSEAETRLGITVTRKIGNAVTRNRIKRLVREVFRRHRGRVPSGLDMVWVAKQQAESLEYEDVLGDFESLVRSLGRVGRKTGSAQSGSARSERKPDSAAPGAERPERRGGRDERGDR